ncbi:MAG: acyl carrier protein [Defluviitaleaceae bacterium]|nr:acyl carrier protein [Defluviitaleaceae bacterium]
MVEIFDMLRDIIFDVLDDKELKITRETSAEDIEDWDSLAQISIISSCESAFGIRFELSEVLQMKNVGDTVDLIMEKIK